MQTKQNFGIAAILLSVVAIFLIWRYLHMQTVAVHVGESMRDVLAQSSAHRFHAEQIFDDVPVIWPENDLIPQTFMVTYNAPDGNIQFPHARLVWATQYAGVVTNVLIGVSERKLSLKDFLKEVQGTTFGGF